MARKKRQDGTPSETQGARTNGSGANPGFESRLFLTTDRPRETVQPHYAGLRVRSDK